MLNARLASWVCLLSVLGLLTAAPTGTVQPEAPARPDPALARLRAQLNPEFPNWSPAQVIERVAEHLAAREAMLKAQPQQLDEAYILNELAFIRYLDASDVPRHLLPALTGAAYFGAPSASSAPATYTPQPVPNTDNRLFWLDLRWLRWSPDVWENISAEDPYFREPIVPSDSQALHYMKSRIGNGVIRASWFLFYTFDTTQFLAQGATQADDAFMYQLIYGVTLADEEVKETVNKKVRGKIVKQEVKKKKKVVKSAAPKTAAEFEKFWGVDFEDLKIYPVDKGAVVDEKRSVVSRRNRVIWRVRSKRGAYWRTFDVFRSAGDQDFIESPFPRQFDAGEHIFVDEKGAQFYLLSDGKGKRLEFGDPRIVHDDVSGNVALLTAASCIHCHDSGILPFRNEHEILRDIGMRLNAATPDRAYRSAEFFLRDIKRLVEDDQRQYARFIRDANGLTPEENSAGFTRIRQWYAGGVDFTQACRELGADPQQLADALGTQATKGRLGRLVLDGQAIPRLTWERGGYQEAGLLLIEHLKKRRILGVNAH